MANKEQKDLRYYLDMIEHKLDSIEVERDSYKALSEAQQQLLTGTLELIDELADVYEDWIHGNTDLMTMNECLFMIAHDAYSKFGTNPCKRFRNTL